MNKFSILMLALAICLFTQEVNAQDKTTAKPKILDEKTWTWEGSTYNYAKCKDLTFEVSMGNKPDGVGCADAGVEIENVRNVKLSVDAPPSFNRYDENSFAGFMVDYHTSAGYTKRVGLSIGMYSEKRWAKTPIWGKVTVPSQFVDLGKKKEYDLDLQKWAPDGWDGRVWFVVSLQNTGRNTTLKAKAELLGEEERTKVVQKSKEEPAKPKDDKALLQGRWYAVAEEAVGKTLSKDEVLTMNKILDVKGDEFHMERTDGGKRGSYVGTIRLGQADGQKLFDFEGKRPSGAQVELHGIYELTQDVFKVCYAVVPAGSKYTRPREFRTFAGTPTVFVTFKRSAGKVEIAQKPKEEPGKKQEKENKTLSEITADFFPHTPGTTRTYDTQMAFPDGKLAVLRSVITQKENGIRQRGTTTRIGSLDAGKGILEGGKVTWLRDVNVPLPSPEYHRIKGEYIEIGNTNEFLPGIQWELASFKSLVRLELSYGRIGNAKELAPLVNLEHLDLRFNRVNGAGMKELAALKKLTWLDLSFNEVTDEGARELAGLTSLTVLELGYSKELTDAGLKELTALKKLTRLGLSDTKITGKGLKHLASFKELAGLSLDRIQLGRKDQFDRTIYVGQVIREIEALEVLSNLKGLNLSGNGLSSDFDVRNLKAALPKCNIYYK